MKLIAATLLITLAVGYLLGGRLRNLSHLNIRWAPLALVAFTMQLINPPDRWPLVMLLGSFVLLSIFAVQNIQTTGFVMILTGVVLNFVVIAANSGMPVSRQALRASGQVDTVEDLTDDADSYVKHHLATDEDMVLFLGDVIALPPPMSQAISVGDIFTYGGVMVVIAAGMRLKAPVKEEETDATTVAVGGGPTGG